MDTTFTQTRLFFTPNSTVSELWLPGSVDRECFVLEDAVRPPGAKKVPGATAIPYGTYEVLMQPSAHYGRLMPHLQNVPDFTEIMVHTGNRAIDTKGCLCVGMTHPMPDLVSFSQKAFDRLLPKILAAIKEGRLFWKIIDGREAVTA